MFISLPDNKSCYMKKIVIAIDSFKGCLTSLEAGKAASEGVRAACPECETIVLPVADGGEGMLDVLISASNGKYRTIPAHDPLMVLRDARYGISGDGQTAFIEMAAICGLPLVPSALRNPMLTTTYGTGELIRDALELGCRNFIIGLGGSATNDAGLGMLQALGYHFLNKAGEKIGCIESELPMNGASMSDVAFIDSSDIHPAIKESRFTAACDVQNPFCGKDGAAFIFAPQKGADQEMVLRLDSAMKQLAEVISKHTGEDISLYPGAGAAGGMGGALFAFLRAELKPGIQLLLDTLHFSEKIKDADIIITGEGKSDQQTLMGKVPSGILEEARKQKIPVILLSGSIEDVRELNNAGFKGVFSITPSPISLEQAMKTMIAKANIKRAAEQICRIIQY